jgi:hypothetical protein
LTGDLDDLHWLKNLVPVRSCNGHVENLLLLLLRGKGTTWHQVLNGAHLVRILLDRLIALHAMWSTVEVIFIRCETCMTHVPLTG